MARRQIGRRPPANTCCLACPPGVGRGRPGRGVTPHRAYEPAKEFSMATASDLREEHDDEPSTPKEGIALALSGGGYRAMLFHVGAILRLNEAGLLPRLKRISSVS